ncbi:MAG: carboxypeptidase-like regulatory domain-containing protein, partial [Firmicutes bacterium]|nr:carboxypeptidase-like regulatory domain-containing protein [Bacillota bacterium]
VRKIRGVIANKDGQGLEGVTVGLKNSEFEDVFSTMTNGNGEYFLEAEAGYYPFMYAVKEYGENFLEYWCHDISLTDDIVIHAQIDKLEIYGLHCFAIKGAYPALTIYFRPMCLAKYKAGEEDIAPDLSSAMIQVSVNGRPVSVFLLNKVEEFAGDRNMTAYLMQVSRPSEFLPQGENFLHVHVVDEFGHVGEASLYF